MKYDSKNSSLELWLRERNMTTNKFVSLIGCSRPVVWKVKRGMPICPKYAKRIFDLTGGSVDPDIESPGGRRV